MELRTSRGVKRTHAIFESPAADRIFASGSHAELSQLSAFHSDSGAAISTAQISLASGSTGIHPWNTLCLDLQERILMPLPLHELGRAVCLGKAFCSAFQQRALQVEQGLISAGVAALGRPLLEGVGRVLQRYHQRTDLATGCGAMRLEQRVCIDRFGTVTTDNLESNRWKCQEPNVMVGLSRQPGTLDVIEAQDLTLWVGGPNWTHWARLELSGPTRRSSASLRNEAAYLHVVPDCDCLGAMIIIAQQAGQDPLYQNSRESLQHKLGAHPVDSPFHGGENSVQHAQGHSGEPTSGTCFEASQAMLHPPPRQVAAGAIRRVCASPEPIRQQVSGELVEQGMITALKLAEGFQVPCCQIKLQCNVRIFACQNKWYCRKHRVRA